MPNEFEKQVQQMMDELKLVPSEPVWQKVEMQIRKRKDRRRMILWISLLILLLGGGLWIGFDHYSNNVAYHKTKDELQKQNQIIATPKKTTTNTTTKNIDKKPRANKKESNEKLTFNKPAVKNEVVINKNADVKIGLIEKSVARENSSSQKINQPKEKLIIEKKTEPTKDEETLVAKTGISETVIYQPIEKINQVVSSLDIIRPAGASSAFPLDEIQMKPAILIPDSVKQNMISQPDTASLKKSETKKLAESKCKYKLVAASGLSGLSRLNIFNGLKSADARYYYSPSTNVTGPGIIYYGPSEVRKGLSFSIGGSAQRQLGKRLSFSIGLQYNYYSNSILVGNRISRDTMFRAYPVSQYFTNAARAYSYSIAAESYHNHYHFISLPVSIRWQMSKNLPLYFYTGFSVQQMIQTNALVFDYNAQAYYHSNKAFNKTQVFTEYGFNYSIPFNKKYFTVGPEFQYGLPSLEKNNSTHHLFSYGLKLQLQLNKK